LSQVRRWQSGVGHGPRLRSVRMTRTFQNGRERPTPCISGFFWRPQCTRLLHRGREQPPRFIVRFVCLYFPSCRSHNVGNHIARFCCLFLHFARLLSPALSVISRIVSAGRPRRLLDKMPPSSFDLQARFFFCHFSIFRATLVMIQRPTKRRRDDDLMNEIKKATTVFRWGPLAVQAWS